MLNLPLALRASSSGPKNQQKMCVSVFHALSVFVRAVDGSATVYAAAMTRPIQFCGYCLLLLFKSSNLGFDLTPRSQPALSL